MRQAACDHGRENQCEDITREKEDACTHCSPRHKRGMDISSTYLHHEYKGRLGIASIVKTSRWSKSFLGLMEKNKIQAVK